MVQAIRAFLEFSYIARHDVHDTHSLTALKDALQRFHHHREIFCTSGIRTNGFNLPRQHSLNHYIKLTRAFGAPNGLCSSIMESKHIKAVKEPWRCSSRFEALSQMLLTNQRLDKLAAARVDFATCGMLAGTCLSSIWDQILVLHSMCFCYLISYVSRDLQEAHSDSDPDQSPLHIDEDLDDANNGPTVVGDIIEGRHNNDYDSDENDGDVDGPRVEAYVNLS